MNETAISRVARAVHELRPEWSRSGIESVIRTRLIHRTYSEVAIAFVAVATDQETKTPGRVCEPGPWWKTSMLGELGSVPAVGPGNRTRCDKPGHEYEPADNCRACAADRKATQRPHTPRTQPNTRPPQPRKAPPEPAPHRGTQYARRHEK